MQYIDNKKIIGICKYVNKNEVENPYIRTIISIFLFFILFYY